MNTTAAATEAHVTVATIRTWCRRGVLAAVKTAGRWIIDTASLARRIAIGQWRTAVTQPDYAALASDARAKAAELAPPAGIRERSNRDRMRPEYRLRQIFNSAAVNWNLAARMADDGDTTTAANIAEQAARSYEAATSQLNDLRQGS